MQTSIIIRVKNEKENLKKLFRILKNQTNQDFEILIVNNNSIDGSGEVVFDFFSKNRVRVVNIDRFSYPKACNLGADKAKGKFLVYLSAHSYPISRTWLEDGLSNFKSDKIAGVSAYVLPGPESTIWEKIFFEPKYIEFIQRGGGDLANTNSIVRRDLWEKHKFDESLKLSEDLEWSIYWKRKGYEIIIDPRFRVYHSHHLGLLGLIKQEIKWKKSNRVINKKFKD